MTTWLYFLAFVVVLYPWLMLTLFLHRITQVLTGRVLGYAPYRMLVGNGPWLFKKSLGGVSVILRLSRRLLLLLAPVSEAELAKPRCPNPPESTPPPAS